MKSKLRVLPYVLFLLPFDIIVGLCLWVLAPLCFKTRKHGESPRKKLDLSASIIILNWDGKHLLQECLPAVIEAVRCDGRNHEIVVVDNGSTDGSVDFVHRNFPLVRVLALDRNYGFSAGNNRGVDAVRTDIVVLLNND